MTPREQAAFNAGIEAMRQMAMIAAITIETRDDAGDLRQHAAAAALHGLAEGAKALLLEPMSSLGHCLNTDQNNRLLDAAASQGDL